MKFTDIHTLLIGNHLSKDFSQIYWDWHNYIKIYLTYTL